MPGGAVSAKWGMVIRVGTYVVGGLGLGCCLGMEVSRGGACILGVTSEGRVSLILKWCQSAAVQDAGGCY